MALEVGIVGLPNVGKSTLFNALTAGGADAANYAFCTIEPNVGMVPVPDARLEKIRAHIESEKLVPAAVRIVDIAGLVKGASTGEGLGNKFLSHIREVDAVLHVVRCFENEDVVHVDGEVDPIRDVETIDTELMLADMQVLEGSLEKRKKQSIHDKELVPIVALMEKCLAVLQDGKPIRSLGITDPEELAILRGFGMITAKKVLYLANVDEGDPEGKSAHVDALRKRAVEEKSGVVVVCSKLESELRELDEDDQKEMLESMGLKEPALGVLVREAYRLLDLQSYFTAGPKEIHAWTIPVGATAPQAAGVIHTDFEKGFIKAEIYSVNDLFEHKTEAGVKSAGKLRIEGKEYVFQDGDVVHFRFNV